MPSTESFRERIALSVSQGKGNKDALRAIDYALANPSTLEQKQAQTQRAKAAREVIRMNNSWRSRMNRKLKAIAKRDTERAPD